MKNNLKVLPENVLKFLLQQTLILHDDPTMDPKNNPF